MYPDMLLTPTLPEYITFGESLLQDHADAHTPGISSIHTPFAIMVSNPPEDYDDDTESTMSDVQSGSPAPSLYSFASSVDERFIVGVFPLELTMYVDL